MNILVIGNGFDLAHGLPTKYGDFLDFIYYCNKEVGKNSRNDKFNPHIRSDVKKIIDNTESKIKDKVKKYISLKCNETTNNYWIEHFFTRRKEIGEGWINFEQEMLNVLKKLEYNGNRFYKIFFDILNYYNRIDENTVIEKGDLIAFNALIEIQNFNKDNIMYVNDDEFKKIYSNITSESEDLDKYKNLYEFKDIKITSKNAWEMLYSKYEKNIYTRLINDINNLILAFELYLKLVVEGMQVINNNADILKIKGIDKVISFNYTHTIANYKIDNKNIDFIHGEVRENLDLNNNNMVLGIDEYLPDDIKNKDLNFIHFKKYFQRIYKNTGAEYKEWLNYDDNINIYFFGHSLDSSDKDILKEIFECKNAKIKIFYVSEEQKAVQITNLVKIIGQDNLIKYSYAKNKKIEFIQQMYKIY